MMVYKFAGVAAVLAMAAVPAIAQQPGGTTMPAYRPGMSQPAPAPGNTTVSGATVTKVGAALREVTQIRQGAAQRLQAATTDAERQAVARQATSAEESAVMRQGISVGTYNQVIAAAHRDPSLRQRVLAAANSAG